jgi:membrane protein implicated in regulation of membrane protease activity
MIGSIRVKDIPQFLVGSIISIGFLVILVPVWIANPGLVSNQAALWIQLGFIVIVSMIASSAICRWLKERARGDRP